MKKAKPYRYVGPSEILTPFINATERYRIGNPSDVVAWAKQTGQLRDKSSEIVATFIVDESGALWIADRHSEHVNCARGGPVLSAGEITFQMGKAGVAVSAASISPPVFAPNRNHGWPSQTL